MDYSIAAASVLCFSPGHFRRRASRPVSYYALFKWWLLLSQHPGCFRSSTSFSRSYGCILPSSLTRVFPRTLGFSPRPPVSVSVRVVCFYLAAFLDSVESMSSSLSLTTPRHSSGFSFGGFAYQPPYKLRREFRSSRLPALLCHSITQSTPGGTGISTSCPSPTTSVLCLGPDLP